MVEVALFMGQATATRDSGSAQAGNRHAILVFLRQEKGASPDFALAESELATRGWVKIQPA